MVPETRLPKQPILWLVDTVQSFSWIGPGPIEWAEGRFFAMRDAYRRFKYNWNGDLPMEDKRPGEEESETGTAVTEQVIQLPPGLEVGASPQTAVWPPKPVVSKAFKRLAKGEGVWKSVAPKFVRTLPGAPPAIMQTYTRPDKFRPYVTVQLIAMDMRQLELHMVAGHEDPRPTTGSAGTGKIPRRAQIFENMVAGFNGAFKTEHGAYGMMVERNILLPPQNEAATIASFDDGTAAMGSWPNDLPIPESMVSMRQNMDPLVENNVVNPRRRYLWGFTLDEDITNMNTIRSGICMTPSGALIYAWGEDLTATTLGSAMNAAGCAYGMHLDMNPLHTAYIFYRFAPGSAEEERPTFKSRLAIPEMRYSPTRYIYGAPKDFFFLTLKNHTPGADWTAEGLAQPAPAFVPAMFTYRSDSCQLVAVNMARASATLDPGDVPTNLAPSLANKKKDISKDLLLSIPMGRWSTGRGQIVDGTVVASLVKDRPTLGLTDRGTLAIGMWPLDEPGRPVVTNGVQGDWLMNDETSPKKIAVIGKTNDNWLFVGQGSGAELSRLLQQHNVTRVVAFKEPPENDAITIRSPNGMIDLKGAPNPVRDITNTTLNIVARPAPLGAKKLETAFAGLATVAPKDSLSTK